ncbi:hypothetical protein BDW62DRAFT_206660 [Aspergillus aurantiobrunneus]
MAIINGAGTTNAYHSEASGTIYTNTRSEDPIQATITAEFKNPTCWRDIPPPPRHEPAIGSLHHGWYLCDNGVEYFGFGQVVSTHRHPDDGYLFVRVEPYPGRDGDFFDPATNEPMPVFKDYTHNLTPVRSPAKLGDERIGWYIASDGKVYRGFGWVVQVDELDGGRIQTWIAVGNKGRGHFYEPIPEVRTPGMGPKSLVRR